MCNNKDVSFDINIPAALTSVLLHCRENNDSDLGTAALEVFAGSLLQSGYKIDVPEFYELVNHNLLQLADEKIDFLSGPFSSFLDLDRDSQFDLLILGFRFCQDDGGINSKRLNFINNWLEKLHLGGEAQIEFKFMLAVALDLNDIGAEQKYTPAILQNLIIPRDQKPNWSSNDSLEILGVPQESTQAQIKKAYHFLMKRFHPDTTSNLADELRQYAEEKSKILTQAYNDCLERKSA